MWNFHETNRNFCYWTAQYFEWASILNSFKKLKKKTVFYSGTLTSSYCLGFFFKFVIAIFLKGGEEHLNCMGTQNMKRGS